MGYGLGLGYSGYMQGQQQQDARQDALKQQGVQNALAQRELSQRADLERERLQSEEARAAATLKSQEGQWTREDARAWYELQQKDRTINLDVDLGELHKQFLSGTLDARTAAETAKTYALTVGNALAQEELHRSVIQTGVDRNTAGAKEFKSWADARGSWFEGEKALQTVWTLYQTRQWIDPQMFASINQMLANTGVNVQEALNMAQERYMKGELFPEQLAQAKEATKQAGQTTAANVPAAQVGQMRGMTQAALMNAVTSQQVQMGQLGLEQSIFDQVTLPESQAKVAQLLARKAMQMDPMGLLERSAAFGNLAQGFYEASGDPMATPEVKAQSLGLAQTWQAAAEILATQGMSGAMGLQGTGMPPGMSSMGGSGSWGRLLRGAMSGSGAKPTNAQQLPPAMPSPSAPSAFPSPTTGPTSAPPKPGASSGRLKRGTYVEDRAGNGYLVTEEQGPVGFMRQWSLNRPPTPDEIPYELVPVGGLVPNTAPLRVLPGEFHSGAFIVKPKQSKTGSF